MERFAGGYRVELAGAATGCACPKCGAVSARVHSRYLRRVRDLPVQGERVIVSVHAREFLCDNRSCARRVFCERFGEVVRPFARMTGRFGAALQSMALLVSARVAARIGLALGYGVSDSTFLRCAHRYPTVKLVTVVNSAMMVIGWDRPKEEVFAYEHLLGRLGIVVLFVVLWEFSAVSAAVRTALREGLPRAPVAASFEAVKAWVAGVDTNRSGVVAELYTAGVATVSVVVVAFQAFLRPAGGAALYLRLVLAFVVVTVLVFGVAARWRRRR